LQKITEVKQLWKFNYQHFTGIIDIFRMAESLTDAQSFSVYYHATATARLPDAAA
jgi:hypothetical protein